MATVDNVLDALVAKVQEAVNLMPLPYRNAVVYKGWPQPEELGADLGNRICHVSIYPNQHGEKYTSRYNTRMGEMVSAPVVNLSAVVSAPKLRDGDAVTPASGTITFVGSVNPGLITLTEIGSFFVDYAPPMGVPLDVVATQLAEAINTHPDASGLVTATADAATVTVTANTPGEAGNNILLGFKIGGSGMVMSETGRRLADFQIHVWTFDDNSRGLLSNEVDELLATTTFLPLADTTLARLKYHHTVQSDAEIKHGVYRRILHYTVEYVSTRMVDAVQVLETQVTYMLNQ